MQDAGPARAAGCGSILVAIIALVGTVGMASLEPGYSFLIPPDLELIGHVVHPISRGPIEALSPTAEWHRVPSVSAKFRLYGNALEGWGFSPTAITNPGPTLNVTERVVTTLVLNGTDGFAHGWFVDFNGDMGPNPGEPMSPTFTSEVTFSFTPTQVGTFAYRCRFHPSTMTGMIVIKSQMPPVGSFTVLPAIVGLNEPVRVDASASRNGQGSSSGLRYRWDWEDDGVFDTGWSTNATASHAYPSGGEKTIRLEVIDDSGLIGESTGIAVVDASPFSPAGPFHGLLSIGLMVGCAGASSLTYLLIHRIRTTRNKSQPRHGGLPPTNP